MTSRTPRRRTAGSAAVAAVVILATVATGLAITSAPAIAEAVRTEQWQLRELNARTAWRYASGTGVVVAVLDSGVDATHPDLAGRVLPGADFVDTSKDGRSDPVGHGTTVAALIAGRARAAYGVSGLAPGAKILPVRVLDAKNKYDDATVVADGLRWAVDNGASVVNMSLGGPTRSDALARAVEYALRRDVVVVACTGNQSTGRRVSEGVWHPAREQGVLAVAGLAGRTAEHAAIGSGSNEAAGRRSRGPDGTAGGETLWRGSITGPQTVLTAPAVNVRGARPGGYWRVQGTSFAAPLVTAAAALVRSRWPKLNAANVINRLIRTARDLGPAGRDSWYGYGEVDPAAALTASVPTVDSDPLTGQRAVPGEAGNALASAVANPGQQPASIGYRGFPSAVPGSRVAFPLMLLLLLIGTATAILRHRGRVDHRPDETA